MDRILRLLFIDRRVRLFMKEVDRLVAPVLVEFGFARSGERCSEEALQFVNQAWTSLLQEQGERRGNLP